MLVKSLTVGSMAVCCYIVSCEDTGQGIIIDPGGNEDEILALVKKLGVTVKYIVATHGHPDHVCGNAILQKATGAKIVMHEDDAAFFGTPEAKQYFSMLGLAFSPVPDLLVRDGDTIEFGNCALKVIHTPGHTPGGICLYRAPDLFSGDSLFVGGVGRTDFPGGDSKALYASLTKKLLALPDETVVWPGHGYGGAKSTIGEERKSNPYLAGDFW
ncbi:MAG: MBL fold metallo-hydrolase [Proteobacteria bacterium]|nr:MBL fold metallo-hydrolase [Pseudomonadota bacterium]MBU1717352.1 MBL fold metallo-hydrolase [Pseudomonadota bacterium]